jgi:hypothetical protein
MLNRCDPEITCWFVTQGAQNGKSGFWRRSDRIPLAIFSREVTSAEFTNDVKRAGP